VHGTGPAGSPFEKDFFIILNSCVRGQGPVNQDVNVNPNNDMKEMTVDYVRVYLRETAPPSGFVYQSADTQLITKGRQILDYMWGLHLRTSAQGKKVLSGQTSFSTIDQIRLDTGEWPAIAMESIIGYTGAYPYWQGTTVRTNLLNYWNNGAVVVARLDFGNPVTLGVANSSPISLANKINAYTENNNSVNNALKQSLDICVTDFQWLQSQGCAVIIHMLMEMNQSGFWWGSNINGGDDPAATYSAYINLYRYVVNYFMARCHNLIFQFSGAAWYTGTLRGTHRNTNFYPGDSYVDIVV
jgi:beta-mannanase